MFFLLNKLRVLSDVWKQGIWLVVFRLALWKMMDWKSVGMMKFPTYNGKNVPFGTNQVRPNGHLNWEISAWSMEFLGVAYVQTKPYSELPEILGKTEN